jgi:hypothetical protein
MLLSLGIFTKTVLAAFSPETDFTFNASTGTILKYIGAGGAVEIPAQINGVNVTSINKSTFYNCRALTSITIIVKH